MTHFPPTDREDLVAIWLWSGMKGVFSHETALVLHQLCDSLPSNIQVTFPDINVEERRWYGCVPMTAPARLIRDCRAAHVDPLIIDQAVEEGLERGVPTQPLGTGRWLTAEGPFVRGRHQSVNTVG